MPTDFSKLTDEQKAKWSSVPLLQCGVDDKPGNYVSDLLEELDYNVLQDDQVDEKEFLLDAIIGIGFSGNSLFGQKCAALGFAKCSANQHGEKILWDIDALKQQRKEVLLILYKALQVFRRKKWQRKQ